MANILKQVTLSKELFYLGEQTINDNDQQILSSTANSAESTIKIKEQAHEQGFQLGFAQGMAAGLAKGEQQAIDKKSDVIKQIEQLLHAIPSALNASRQALRMEIADIVLAITQQFFIQQQQNKEAIAQQITATLNYLNEKQAITLALHPGDLALLQQGQLKVDFSQCKEVRIVGDESLNLGGCRITSEHGVFDASIERQIDCLKQALLQLKIRELS